MEKQFIRTATATDNVNIAALLPSDRGETTYSVTSSGYTSVENVSIDANTGLLTFSTKTSDSETTDTITVKAEMLNYADTTITVIVKLVDKTPVTISGVTAQNGTYNGSAQQGYTGSIALDFTIAKKKITEPAQPAAVTYNGGAQTYSVTATSDYTVSGGVQTNANETGYDVTIALTDTANTEWATGGTADLTQKFIINKAALTVTADDKSAIVGAVQPELTDTAQLQKAGVRKLQARLEKK